MPIGSSRLSERIVNGPSCRPCDTVTMESEIANRYTGIAHMMSISRDSTASTQPPKKPAEMPTRAASTMHSTDAAAEISSELRPP